MKRVISVLTLACFFATGQIGICPVSAQETFVLPKSGEFVPLSSNFNPIVMRGLRIDPKNPFRFSFLVDEGDSKFKEKDFKEEAQKVIKYFLTSLTIPDDDLWVNLSPYEKNRIIPTEFGKTEMGRDLLAQDYILKQITASLIYPEKELGKTFWNKVYKLAKEKYGSANIPINTFNKVWIVPNQATVYEHKGTAFVMNYHLKVMLEEDYLALNKHSGVIASEAKQSFKKIAASPSVPRNDTHSVAFQIIRDIILPELEKEVNAGKNFAPLHQIFYSLILATWYKTKVKQDLLNQVYADKKKIEGIKYSTPTRRHVRNKNNRNVSPGSLPSKTGLNMEATQRNEPFDVETIYQQYLQAFKKGVYNYIKDEIDPLTQQIVPRKYFSGGVVGHVAPKSIQTVGAEALKPDVLSKFHLRNVSGDMALISQNSSQDNDFAGGLMGRWKYEKAILNQQKGTLVLHNAVRIPRKDGIIEPEFFINGENKPRDIILKIRKLRSNESHMLFKALWRPEGIPHNDYKYRELTQTLVRDESAIKHRIYGAAVDGIPFIREDIFLQGNKEQIREAFEHEVMELAGLSHDAIRQAQYAGNLRLLIRDLSSRDKKDILSYSADANRNVLLKQYFSTRRETLFLSRQNKATATFTTITPEFRSDSKPNALYDGGLGRFGRLMKELEESDFIHIKTIKVVTSSQFTHLQSLSFSVNGKEVYMYFEDPETLVLTQGLWDQIKEGTEPNLYFEMAKALILLAWAGFQGDSVEGFAEEIGSEESMVIYDSDNQKEQTKLETFFYLDHIKRTKGPLNDTAIRYLGYLLYMYGFDGGRMSIFSPETLAEVLVKQIQQIYGSEVSLEHAREVIKSDQFDQHFYYKSIEDYKSKEVQGDPGSQEQLHEILSIFEDPSIQERLTYELKHFDTIYPGQRWRISMIEDIRGMGMSANMGTKLVLDYPLAETGHRPRLYVLPPEGGKPIYGHDFKELPSYELEVKGELGERKSLGNDFMVIDGQTRMPLKLFLEERLDVDLKRSQYMFDNLFIVENGGEIARNIRTGHLEIYFIGNEKNSSVNFETGIINGANIAREEEEEQDEKESWQQTFNPLYAPTDDPDIELALRYHFHPTKYKPIISSGDIDSKINEIYRTNHQSSSLPELIINFNQEGRLYLPRANINWRRALKVLKQITKHHGWEDTRYFNDDGQAERWERQSLEFEKEVARFFDIVSLKFNDDGSVKEWKMLEKADSAMGAHESDQPIIRDGVDQRAYLEQVLGSLPGPKPTVVMADEKNNQPIDPQPYRGGGVFQREFNTMLNSQDIFVLYGYWESIKRVAQAFGETEEKYRQKENIKIVLNGQGLVGVWNVPEGVNAVIQEIFLTKSLTVPVLANIVPLTSIIDFYRQNNPFAKEILTTYIDSLLSHSAEPILSYPIFQSIIDHLMKRHDEGETRKKNAKKRSDPNEYKIDQENREFETIITRVLRLLTPETLRGYLRQFVIDRHLDSGSIREYFPVILQDHNEERKVQDMLWDIYLDARNNPQQNILFAKTLIHHLSSSVGNSQAVGWIYRILSEGNLEHSHKAIRILLGMNINKDDQRQLFYLIKTTSPYQDILAAYTLAHVKIFGMETQTTRGGSSNFERDGLMSLQSEETRNMYYYLMNIDAILKKGGVADRDVDHRIFQYAAALDEYAEYPGQFGHTWFSNLRQKIHRAVNRNDLYRIEGILRFWQNLDPQVFARISEKRKFPWETSTEIAKDFDKDDYSRILNNLLASLIHQGDINPGLDMIEQLTHLEKNYVIEKLKEANLKEDNIRVEKVEHMLNLYFALSQKFTTNIPSIIQGINDLQESKANYLGFCRQEYSALKRALKGQDEQVVLEAVVNLRLAIRNDYLTHPMPNEDDRESRDNESYRREKLGQLDHDLHILGRYYLNNVFSQTIQHVLTLDDIRSNTSVLISVAKFIQSEGLGGVDLEQFIEQMQEGNLSHSQWHDLIRALQTQVLKIVQQIDKNIRFVTPHMLQAENSLDIRWQGLSKFEKIPTGHGWDREVLTEQSKKDIENALVDELIREAGLDVFKASLTQFDQILENQPAEQESAQPLPVDTTTPHALDRYFLHFGQGNISSTQRLLLSLWSKKGLNLVRMSQRGIAVPPGVVVSSELMTRPDIIHSEPFKKKVMTEIDELRKHSKYPDLKLLLYARSGSAFMLPGLLSTIANIGMNDKEASELEASTKDTWFAYDTYASFIRSFGMYVFGIEEKFFQEVFNMYTKDKVSGERMKQVVEQYKEVIGKHGGGKQIPETMIDQVIMAMEAVYASWDSPNAKEYRQRHRISQSWGTVVILQKGVFGNIQKTHDGKISGAGSASLMTAPDGQPIIQGEFRYQAQGDQIMSGADQNTVSLNQRESSLQNGQTFEQLNPELYKKVLQEALRLKQIFGHDQLIEFVIERGDVWITQSNDDFMREDFPEFAEQTTNGPIVRGKGLSGGAVRGWAAHTVEKATELMARYQHLKQTSPQEVKDVDGVILLLDRINPEMISQIPKGVHILAKKLSVHAVSLAQESGISVVAEVPDDKMIFDIAKKEWVIAGRFISDGQVLSMDGHRNQLAYHQSGNIYLGSVPIAKEEEVNQASTDDHAMNSQQTPGGIDLTSKRYKILIKSDGQEIAMDFNPAMIHDLNFDGLEFHINHIQPIPNPREFLLEISK